MRRNTRKEYRRRAFRELETLSDDEFNALIQDGAKIVQSTVFYNGVSHGSWCKSKAPKFPCRHCRKTVFFFQCDCGCRVLFDKLGWPWPQHKYSCAGR